MYKIFFSCALLLVLLASCSHKVVRTNYKAPDTGSTDCPVIIKKQLKETSGLENIGEVKLSDSGVSLWCSEKKAMEILKRDACNIKADIVYIAEEAPPDFFSTCYRCRAVFYKYKSGISEGAKDSLSKRIAAIPVEEPKPLAPKGPKPVFPRLRLAVTGGYGYLTAPIASDIPPFMKPFLEDLKSGAFYGFDAAYYFTEKYGVGFRYYNFNSSAMLQGNIYIMKPDSTLKLGKLGDDVSISFIGPSFNSRYLSPGRKHSFLYNIGLGYLGYNSKKVIVDKFLMTGSTVGLLYEIAYDYSLSSDISIGVQVAYISGVLTAYDWNDGTTTKRVNLDNKNYEGISHLDLGIGLRYLISW